MPADKPDPSTAISELKEMAAETPALEGTAEGYILGQMRRLDKDAVNLQERVSYYRAKLMEAEGYLLQTQRARAILEVAMEASSGEPQ